MEFISTGNFDSEAEKIFWNAAKKAFEDKEPGYCWHQHPFTTYGGITKKPDFIILHPIWGLNVIEVKGCSIEQIEDIEGNTWYMQDYAEDEMMPYSTAENKMYSIRDRMKLYKNGILRNQKGECKIWGRAFVGLPYINEPEWRHRFGEHPSAPKWEAICSTDLSSDKLYDKFANSPVQPYVSFNTNSEEWKTAFAVISGSGSLSNRKRRPTKRQDSKAAYLRKVEEKIKTFDIQQHRVAVQTPEGAQRIRGLAGTGKTIVLAQKAAYMHVQNPDWKIVFTFYSQSLYGQITRYITKFVQELSHGELETPDWNNVIVMHAWGSREQNGFYRLMTNALGEEFRNFGNAKAYFGTTSGHIAFNDCCGELLDKNSLIPQFFDAILIDEAQDFGKNYFRLCYETLKKPKRIIWGYDEVQSLEQLEIPTAESLFGKDINGNSLVSLDGLHPGEIEKDMILYHCYRNPRPILIAAHAFGLGLKRLGGAVQFIDTVAGWKDIGYEIEGASKNNLEKGQEVTLRRSSDNSPHVLEQLAGYHNLVKNKVFDSRQQELDWIIKDIIKNINEEELSPDEIAVISLRAYAKGEEKYQNLVKEEFAYIQEGLNCNNVQSSIIGKDCNIDVFRVKKSVTITHVFRAKGNEASLVYVYGFEEVETSKVEDIIRMRNTAFTAMTRTKGWLVLTGIGSVAQKLFREIDSILEEIGKVNFIVPDMNKIQRNLETYENRRRRKRINKATKNVAKLLENREDVDFDDLPKNQQEQLLKWISKSKNIS